MPTREEEKEGCKETSVPEEEEEERNCDAEQQAETPPHSQAPKQETRNVSANRSPAAARVVPQDGGPEYKDQVRSTRPRAQQQPQPEETADPATVVAELMTHEPVMIAVKPAPVSDSILRAMERLREFERNPVIEAQVLPPTPNEERTAKAPAAVPVAANPRDVKSSSSKQKVAPQKAVARIICEGPDFKQQAQSNFEFYGVPEPDMERVFKEGMEEEVRRQCRQQALELTSKRQCRNSEKRGLLVSPVGETTRKHGSRSDQSWPISTPTKKPQTAAPATQAAAQGTEPVQDKSLWDFIEPDTRSCCTIL